jgi:hypothetical protein
MTLRARQNSNSNERPRKQDIEHDTQDAKQVAAACAQTEAKCHDDEGVEHGGGDDAFDGAVGARDFADETHDLGEAEGEED